MGRIDIDSRSRRRRGILTGIAGLATLVMVALPLWNSPANAAPGGATFGPNVGVAGTTVTFNLTGCIPVPDPPSNPNIKNDIVLEINTNLTNQYPGGAPVPDRQLFEISANNLYSYSAPPEYDFLAGFNVGPAYSVGVACYEPGSNSIDDVTIATIGTFTYLRTTTTVNTTSTTAATTTTTRPATTTSTTTGGSTTTSTAPGSTTTSTAPGSTTTSTAPGSTTTSTAPGSTTTSTAPGSTTTSTAPGATTTSTAPGATTTSTAVATTTSTIPPTSGVSDVTPERGQSVTVIGTGFAPGSTVFVDFLSTPVRIGQLTADANGNARGTVIIPTNAAPGAHEIKLTGTRPDGSALVLTFPVTVVGNLPKTGSETWTMVRIATLLLGLGLLAAGRAQLLDAR